MRSIGIASAIVLAMGVSSAFANDELQLRSAYNAAVSNPDAWSRPYVGISLGLGAGDFVYEDSFAGVVSGQLKLPGSGLGASLRIGYDHVTGEDVLVGIVADYTLSNIWAGGTVTISGTPPLTGEIKEEITALGTVRGRIGFTQKNNLYYAHGGLAIGSVDVRLNGNKVPGIIDNPRIGFAVGAGFEYAIDPNTTFQTEYSYIDLGKFDAFSLGAYKISDHIAFHRLTAGVNLRF